MVCFQYMKDETLEELRAQIAALKQGILASNAQHKKELEAQQQVIDSHKQTIKSLTSKVAQYEHFIETLRENINIDRFIMFAPSSETRPAQLKKDLEETRPVANNPDDMDLGGSPEMEQKKEEKKKWGRQKSTKTCGRNMDFADSSLPKRDVILDLREELKDAAEKDELVFIRKDIHPQIDFVESYVRVRNTVRYIYKNTRTGEIVSATPREHDIIKSGKLTNAFIAACIADKILWGAPYYRQARRINIMAGCNAVNAQLLTNSALCVSSFLYELGEHLFHAVTSSSTLHADETRLLVLHDNVSSKRKLGYFWMLSSTGEHPVSYCRFYPSRSADCARKLLQDCKGVALQADGYSAYAKVVNEMNGIYAEEIRLKEGDCEAEKFKTETAQLLANGILLVGCMAHARRRFFLIYENVYKSRPDSPGCITCDRIMDLIAQLYQIEARLRKTEFANKEAFLAQRKKEAIPVIASLKKYAKERQPLHKAEAKLSEAISYLLNQIDNIANYLESPELTPDNNSQERLIKTICTTRKASMFASTEEGAASWALFHSILQTAILNIVNPTMYLKWIIDAVAKANDEDVKAKDMDWEALMPWNFVEKA